MRAVKGLLVLSVLGGIAAVVWKELPSMQRYLKIERM